VKVVKIGIKQNISVHFPSRSLKLNSQLPTAPY